jgi:hypothetical protein
MRITISALAIAAALVLGACSKHNDKNVGDTTMHSADTTVTTRQVKDTTIVAHDTTVRSDTIHKGGGVVPKKADTTHRRGKP